MGTRNGTNGRSAVRIVTDHVSVAVLIEISKSKSEVNITTDSQSASLS
jgi:hypothetical protein